MLDHIQMRALGAELSVDDIIERVMIRSSSRYDYSAKPDAHLTSPEHLWHYRLQEEHVQLKKRVKELTSRYNRKDQQRQKHVQLQRDIDELREQLAQITATNAQLQHDINRMRLKNSQINETIRNSLDDSIRKRKGCPLHTHTHTHQAKHRQRDMLIVDEPEKSVTTKDIGVACSLDTCDVASQIAKKKAHIESLSSIVAHQQTLITSYESEMESKPAKADCRHTVASTKRVHALERPTSQTTFKPLSSAGSIVKMRRQ